jgi:hypothetical protein
MKGSIGKRVLQAVVVAVLGISLAAPSLALAQTPQPRPTASAPLGTALTKPLSGQEAMSLLSGGIKAADLASRYNNGELSSDQHARAQASNAGMTGGALIGARAGNAIGGVVGGAIGAYFGVPDIGCWLGEWLGGCVGSWAGGALGSSLGGAGYDLIR